MNVTNNDKNKYIFLSYKHLNQKKLLRLVNRFGYSLEVLNIDIVYKLSDNPAFMAGYAQLVNSAMKKTALKKSLLSGNVSFADGTGGGASGFEWFSKISDFLLGGFGSVVDFRTGSSTAQANAVAAQANAAKTMASAEITKFVILGVVVLVFAFIGIKMIKR